MDFIKLGKLEQHFMRVTVKEKLLSYCGKTTNFVTVVLAKLNVYQFYVREESIFAFVALIIMVTNV